MKNLNSIAIIAIFTLLFVFSANFSLARDLWEEQTGLGPNSEIGKAFGTESNPKNVKIITAEIIQDLLGFLGLIFVIMIMYSGYQWMIAGGDSNKVDEAKGRLKNATIGLIIVIAAWGIAGYIIQIIAAKLSTAP